LILSFSEFSPIAVTRLDKPDRGVNYRRDDSIIAARCHFARASKRRHVAVASSTRVVCSRRAQVPDGRASGLTQIPRDYGVFTVTRDFPLAGKWTSEMADEEADTAERPSLAQLLSSRLINLHSAITPARVPPRVSRPPRGFPEWISAGTDLSLLDRNRHDTVARRCLESDSPPPVSLPIFSKRETSRWLSSGALDVSAPRFGTLEFSKGILESAQEHTESVLGIARRFPPKIRKHHPLLAIITFDLRDDDRKHDRAINNRTGIGVKRQQSSPKKRGVRSES